MKDIKEAILRHEALCYAMALALHRDPEDVRDAAVRVLNSRDAILATFKDLDDA